MREVSGHVLEDEMAPQAKNVIPGNADESIWNIMERHFDESQEREIKAYAESKGLMYTDAIFFRAAADRLGLGRGGLQDLKRRVQ